VGSKAIHLAGESRTIGLAASLARRAKGGERIFLYGPLGSGKTTFARGFLRALGVRGAIRSPTFALIHEYRLRERRFPKRVYHMDFYRLKPPELENLGLREYLEDPAAVCLVEWPEAAARRLPADRLELRLEHDERGRTLRARAFGERSTELLRGLRA